MIYVFNSNHINIIRIELYTFAWSIRVWASNSSNASYLMTKFQFRAVAVACVKFNNTFIALHDEFTAVVAYDEFTWLWYSCSTCCSCKTKFYCAYIHIICFILSLTMAFSLFLNYCCFIVCCLKCNLWVNMTANADLKSTTVSNIDKIKIGISCACSVS